VVSLFPPFIKLSNLNFPFCSGRLEVHIPIFDGPESLVFKFYMVDYEALTGLSLLQVPQQFVWPGAPRA
jgi:hypothetical protein